MPIPVKETCELIASAQKSVAVAAHILNNISQQTLAGSRTTGLDGDAVVLLIQAAKLQGMIAVAFGALEAVRLEAAAIPGATAAAAAFAAAEATAPVTSPACAKPLGPDGRCLACGSKGGALQ